MKLEIPNLKLYHKPIKFKYPIKPKQVGKYPIVYIDPQF